MPIAIKNTAINTISLILPAGFTRIFYSTQAEGKPDTQPRIASLRHCASMSLKSSENFPAESQRAQRETGGSVNYSVISKSREYSTAVFPLFRQNCPSPGQNCSQIGCM